MPVVMTYAEEKRLIEFTVTDPWDMADLSEAIGKSVEHLDAADKPLFLLTDMTNGRSIPSGILRQSNTATLTHPNSGYGAVVGANMLVKRMANIMMTLARYKKFGFFDTREEALAHIQKLIEEEGDVANI